MEYTYYQKDGVIRAKNANLDLRLYSVNNHKELVHLNKDHQNEAYRALYELKHDFNLQDTYKKLINEACGL